MSVQVTPEVLSRLLPISALGAEGLRQAAMLARLDAYPRGTHFAAMPAASEVAYLVRGELMLDYPGGVKKVQVGTVGQVAAPLVQGGVHSLVAKAITDVELISFDEKALDILITCDQLVPAQPAKREAFESFDIRRLTRTTFANLSAGQIDSLLACFRPRPVSAGETILRQNEAGDCYYVIERGRALVTREVAGACLELAELEAGDTFGEEALVAETPRNATVTMKTDGALLELGSTDFVRLLREPLLRRIDAVEASRRVASGGCWLDVRFPAEFRQDGLPDALNIPLNELRDALPNLRRDREYVVYCQTGRRSAAAAFLLAQRGMSASLLDGGLKSMMVEMRKTAG